MQSKSAHKQYSSVQISTVDRGRLLLMMYDGGINFLRHAKQGLESNDIVKFARFLSKGQAIIAELMNTLDFEAGGTIAEDLDRLYDFMLFYLTEANLQKNPQKVQKVIDLLDTIASAYREIVESGKWENESAAVGEKLAAAKSATEPQSAESGEQDSSFRGAY